MKFLIQNPTNREKRKLHPRKTLIDNFWSMIDCSICSVPMPNSDEKKMLSTSQISTDSFYL